MLTQIVLPIIYVIKVALGGQLQMFWLLIRSMRFMILSLLILVPLPSHAQQFFEGCMSMAQLDVFNGKQVYSSSLDIVEILPLNDRFDSMAVDNMNFLVNTNSTFLFFLAILAYNLLFLLVELVARMMARFTACRRVGMSVYSKSRMGNVMKQSVKLFIENYLIIAFAMVLHTYSLFETDKLQRQSMIATYFKSGNDAWITVLNFIFIGLVAGAPLAVAAIVLRHRDHLESSKIREKYGVILEGRSKNLKTAMFTVFYMYRRLFSALILVLLHERPFFQIMLMLLLSAIDSIYMATIKPMRNRLSNKFELFNEACILIVSYSMIICMNLAIPVALHDSLGWVMVVVTVINIIGNFGIVIYQVFPEIISFQKQRYADFKMNQMVNKWQELDSILDKNQHIIKENATQLNQYRAIRFCKNWDPQRKWLLKMKIDVT